MMRGKAALLEGAAPSPTYTRFPVLRRLLPLVILALLAAPATAAAAGAAVRPAGDDRPFGDERLSNETTLSRWAHTNLIAPVRARPSRTARRVGRLHWNTEDGPPEVYLVLRSHVDRKHAAWLQIRIPGRPNGRMGWVPEEALSELYVVRTQLIIDRRTLTGTLYRKGKVIWRSPVGVGKAGTPTPGGRFWIRERFKILSRSSGYWPYAFGTSDYSTISEWPGGGVVGIHGPYYQPSRIPGHISHGCIRLRTFDAAWLAAHAGVGTPLRVV
jgi:L,D-transpeptidase catalytic domain